MTDLDRFVWGMFGSVAVEVVNFYRYYTFRAGQLPKRYSQVGFWIVRSFVAVIGGGLVIAYGVEKPIVAANIGAAAPLIIQMFGRGVSTSGQPPQTGGLNKGKHKSGTN